MTMRICAFLFLLPFFLGQLWANSEIVTLPAFPGAAFQTPVTVDLLDSAAYTEWVDGKETRLEKPNGLPQDILLTPSTAANILGVSFGDSKNAGPRYLRIGFLKPVQVGSVLVEGGVSLSVLKQDASYPGDLSDDSQWVPAERLKDGTVSQSEVGDDQYALWSLPAGTNTRALRFKHVAAVSDLTYSAKLGGALVLGDRLVNDAPSAVVSASANNQTASQINNLNYDGGRAWENQEKGKAPEGAKAISDENPAWLTLTWRQPAMIGQLVAFGAGFGRVEVQAYRGTGAPDLKATDPNLWESIGVFDRVKDAYPSSFWPNRFDFKQQITARALRLRLISPSQTASRGNSNDGKRVWLGELMALKSLGEKPLESVHAPVVADLPPPPPIPIRFNLKKAGYVTLVVQKPDGVRVRNLISETWFPAGDNTAWWDGTDDLERDMDAVMHGLYRVPGKFVAPGNYVVRGLVRDEISPHYEFSVYTTGNPPWNTIDNTGAWLANHSPPRAAAFVPAEKSPTGTPVVYLGCYVTEGPAGLAWVDLDGRKLGGKKWVGGLWTAAPFLAFDAGAKAVDGVHVYVGSTWRTTQDVGAAELRLTAITNGEDKPFLVYPLGKFSSPGGASAELGGIAVHDGVLVASLTAKNQLLCVDAKSGKIIGTFPVEKPRGLAFDAKGSLLVLSGNKLLSYASLQDPAHLPEAQTVIASGLEDPVGLTTDTSGNIYVSDQGNSNQVKVFTQDGKLLRTIGIPGAPKPGPYDPLHMNHPTGLAVDSKQQLWVTEADFLPKRVSVWSQDGKLIHAFYGPGKYGGGGTLDPQDKTKFYYAEENKGAMEFKLDWKTGGYELTDVYFRQESDALKLPLHSAAPETPLYYQGHRFFTNAYNSSPTSGAGTAFIFAERDGGVVRAVAGMGRASDWEILQEDAFKTRWPDGLTAGKPKGFFIWSDLNDDGQVQPEEVSIQNAQASGVTVMPDLSFCIARLDADAMQFVPVDVSKTGVPHYDFSKGLILAKGVQGPASSGGDQTLAFANGWTALTLGMAPFSPLSMSGAKNGVAQWSYPSLWPGLHAGHRSARPDRSGELIATTRMASGPFAVKGSDAGPFWALHSNMGRMAIFTYDGLFVANVFEDMRGGKLWRMPSAVRDMSLEGVTLGEENFWPTLTSASDGKVYIVDGSHSALVRLDGMESIQRLPDSPLTVDAADLAKCRAWQMESEATRQDQQGNGILHVAMLPAPPVVDGKLDEWATADWVDIDRRGTKANFNADTKPYDIEAAVIVAGDRLYAAWKTGNDKLLLNSGEMPIAPFKTGGALDLMISNDPGADANRKGPAVGDQRLLITKVAGKPKALLYRAVVPGTKDADKVPFSSPWRTITFDRVDDVSSQIEFSEADGNYEISIPLSVLGLKPQEGLKLKGDVGILRGNGTETVARTYWNNKATGIVSDVPDEATLNPNLWGIWEFKKQ